MQWYTLAAFLSESIGYKNRRTIYGVGSCLSELYNDASHRWWHHVSNQQIGKVIVGLHIYLNIFPAAVSTLCPYVMPGEGPRAAYATHSPTQRGRRFSCVYRQRHRSGTGLI